MTILLLLFTSNAAFSDTTALSLHARALGPGAGGAAAYGIKFTTGRWEFTVQKYWSMFFGIAYQIHFLENSFLSPSLNRGILYPGLLNPGVSVRLRLFSLGRSKVFFRLDQLALVNPWKGRGWEMYPMYLVGGGVSF